MKRISLTRLIKANIEEIEADLAKGTLFIDIFEKLEKKYEIRRAASTWYNTFRKVMNKHKEAEAVSGAEVKTLQQAASVPSEKPKKNRWAATENTEENPILRSLREKKHDSD